MKFSSLPQSCRAVLTLLIGSGPLSRTEVVRALEISDGYPTSTSDTGIRRLVIDGLAKRRSDNSYEPFVFSFNLRPSASSADNILRMIL